MSIFSIRLPIFRGVPFNLYWPSLRKEVQIVKEEDPMEPFMSVSDDVLTLRSGFHIRRIFVIIPLVLLFTAVSILYLKDRSIFFENKKKYAANEIKLIKKDIEEMRSFAEFVKKNGDYGQVEWYEKRIKNKQNKIEGLNVYINKKGTVNIFTHMEALAIIDDDELRAFKIYLFMDCIILIITLLFWILLIFKPRDAEIYFDRQRQIVYTWRSGRVGAAAFDKIGLRTNNTGLCIILNFETKKRDGYTPKSTPAISIDKLVGHVSRDYIYTLGQILAFMDNGKEALITGDSFHRPQEKFFLRDYQKPENLEQRIEAALKDGDRFMERYQTRTVRGFHDLSIKK